MNLKSFMKEKYGQMFVYIAAGAAGLLMAVVIICNLLLIASNIREPGQMPSVFGIRPAIVLSGSMAPTFKAGDVILLKKTDHPDELDVGDVACYLYSGKATTHRVIERFEAEGKPRYIMKGDYNNVEDRLAVDPEQIQGVWTGGRIPGLGRALMFIQSTMGMFLLLICPLAGILAWDIIKRRRADELRAEAIGNENEEGFFLGRELRRMSGLGKRRGETYRERDGDGGAKRAAEQGREGGAGYGGEDRIEYGREGGARYGREGRTEHGREGGAGYGGDGTTEYSRERAGKTVRQPQGKSERSREETPPFRSKAPSRAGRAERREYSSRQMDDFAYYSLLDDSLDYYEELEEAAEHYHRMRESLARFRRMEAVMARCRRLEEELARYEELAERMEACGRRGDRWETGKTETVNGESNQGPEGEPPVDHINRQSRTERDEIGGTRQ